MQLDMGIIAACAPTLRPLLGRALRLSMNINHYREANYYRAGKALAQMPVSGSATRGYLRQNTASGEFLGKIDGKGAEQWATVKHAETISASKSHTKNKYSGDKDGEVTFEKPNSSEEDVILPHPDNIDPDFKGIVKTTEFRIEK